MLWHFIDVKTPLLNTFLSLTNDTFAEREKGVVQSLQQFSKPLICI